MTIRDRFKFVLRYNPLLIVMLLSPLEAFAIEPSQEEFEITVSSAGRDPVSYKFPLIEGVILRLTSETEKDKTLVNWPREPSFLKELARYRAAGFEGFSVSYTLEELCKARISQLELCSVTKRVNTERSTIHDIEFFFGIRPRNRVLSPNKEAGVNSLGRVGNFSAYRTEDGKIYDRDMCGTICYLNYDFDGRIFVSVRIFVGDDEAELEEVIETADEGIRRLMRLL